MMTGYWMVGGWVDGPAMPSKQKDKRFVRYVSEAGQTDRCLIYFLSSRHKDWRMKTESPIPDCVLDDFLCAGVL